MPSDGRGQWAGGCGAGVMITAELDGGVRGWARGAESGNRLQTVDYGSAQGVLESWSPDGGQRRAAVWMLARHDHHRGGWGTRFREVSGGLRGRRRRDRPCHGSTGGDRVSVQAPKCTGRGRVRAPPVRAVGVYLLLLLVVTTWHVGSSSLTRDRTHAPCVGSADS